MKEKETKGNLEELKDRKIDEEVLEGVSGGEDGESLEDLLKSANAKKYKGSLASVIKKK